MHRLLPRALASVAALCASSLLAGAVWAQSEAPVHRKSPFQSEKFTGSAKHYFFSAWGVDKLRLSATNSGNLIRFSYRVAEPERAMALSDKNATPYLLEPRSRAVLQVPVMDKVGALRQTALPRRGQEYWMVFSNKGNLVRPGDRVSVVIGSFHADGLVVE